jgi:TIR domain
MRRWFLSYNARDLPTVQSLEAGLKRKDPGAQVFFAPKSQRAGGYWAPMIAEAIQESTIFVCLVGENGIGPWQVIEYYEALDRHVRSPEFPVVILLPEGRSAPGLPFSTAQRALALRLALPRSGRHDRGRQRFLLWDVRAGLKGQQFGRFGRQR